VFERGEGMNVEEIFQQVMNENCKDPLHRFAELVRQDEREACAQLCDDASLYFIDQGMNAVDGADYCANEIRGRTKPKSDFKNQMDDNWSGII
jgi:hypothetical protein